MEVKSWFDKDTSTLTYCVYDKLTKDAVVIDPVWDYDQASGKLKNTSVSAVADFLRGEGLKLGLILETHAHADHITGAQPLKKLFPTAKIGIGARIIAVQKVFKSIFNFGSEFKVDGSQFDLLLADESEIKSGSLAVRVIFTPGHTPACVSYLMGDLLFVGDAMFMPDSGTGRCDFPEGSADGLYVSIKKLYNLPDTTKVFTGHDYQPGGRPVQWESTIGEQKRANSHIKAETTREEYVSLRTTRDKTLSAPRLLLPSIQVNADGGRLPRSESNGQSYLKMPITAF